MNEVLTTKQMYEADRLAITGGTSGIELMENAGRALFEAVTRHWPNARSVQILCGPGNNGGDGYVVARLLKEAGIKVCVYALVATNALSGDAAIAASRFSGEIVDRLPALDKNHDLIIDALFGAGLSRDLSGNAHKTVEAVRQAGLPVLSVDVPSGLDGDTGATQACCIKADLTVTFFRPKPGHFLLPGKLACGRVEVADIGIPATVLPTLKPDIYRNSPALWSSSLPVEEPRQHKYSRGHVVAVAGGPGKGGAARLAARAALRAGAGLVTLAVCDAALGENAARLEVVMIRPANNARQLSKILSDRRFTAVIVGPGLGRSSNARQMVLAALRSHAHVVIDADGLTVFENEPETLFAAIRANASRNVILTPHSGEFARLFSTQKQAGTKLAATRAAAQESGAVVIYKGPDTVIAAPGEDGRLAINANGTPWLATAGSGDVLAGLIAGLAGKAMPAFDAACAGVWMHARAAELFGPGLISSDLAGQLPAVWRELAEYG